MAETLHVTLQNSKQLQEATSRSIAIAIVYADSLDRMVDRANGLDELGLEAGRYYKQFINEIGVMINAGLDRVGVLKNDGSGDSGSAF